MSIRQLVEDFATYLYLPRPIDPKVLLKAIQDGVASLTWATETFAYAESYDERADRYLGLRAGEQITIPDDLGTGMVVVPDRVLRQLESDARASESQIGTAEIDDRSADLPSPSSPLAGSRSVGLAWEKGDPQARYPNVRTQRSVHQSIVNSYR